MSESRALPPRRGASPAPATDARNRRLILLMAAVAIAPVVVSYIAYYFWPRDARVNYGTLVAAPLPALRGSLPDGAAFRSDALRGRWAIVVAGDAACDASCTAALYASRQARTIQNAERDRVQRVWLVTGDALPPAPLLGEHPDLTVVRVPPGEAAKLPAAPPGANYLLDPLGNCVLIWPPDPDIKAMARDLGRLLRASSIG